MMRTMILSVMSLAAMSTTASAGDHFYFPSHAFAAPPVVYARPVAYAAPVAYVQPVVSYQPAYVVPTTTMTVQSYSVAAVPVQTVSYSTQYFAPAVPMVSTVSYVAAPQMFVSRPVYVAPAYVAPVSYGHYGYHVRPYRGARIRVERDGDYHVNYR